MRPQRGVDDAPSQPSRRAPTLAHCRTVYRTKKGALFAHQLDEIGYGRDRDGVNGAFTRTDESLIAFPDETSAMLWCAENSVDVDLIEKAFPSSIEEA